MCVQDSTSYVVLFPIQRWKKNKIIAEKIKQTHFGGRNSKFHKKTYSGIWSKTISASVAFGLQMLGKQRWSLWASILSFGFEVSFLNWQFFMIQIEICNALQQDRE